MQRKVAYLFLYKNGIKERSVGIVKRYGTADQSEVALELFENTLRKKKWEIYYFGKGGVLQKAACLWGSTTERSRSEARILQCRLCAEAGAGEGVVLLPAETEGQVPEFREYLCARYDEKEVSREELRDALRQKPQAEPGENPCVETAKRLMEEIGKAAGGELIGEENRTLPKKVRAIPASGPEKLLAIKPSYRPCRGAGVTHSVRIVPEELRKLPEAERYGENSYLMHGYYRYRHLLLGRRTRKEREEYMILVPGTYDKKEARLAKQFGFPEFIPVAMKKPETAGAASGRDVFGYFCGKI